MAQQEDLPNTKNEHSNRVEQHEAITAQNFVGRWTVSERKKIGEWKPDEEYAYSKEQFEKRLADLSIEISEQFVRIDRPYFCSGDNQVVRDSVFSVSGTEQSEIDAFLQKELKINPNTYIGYIPLQCGYPLKTIFLYKDKILIQEYGAYFYVLSKKVSDPEEAFRVQKSCKENKNEVDHSFEEICTCENTDDFDIIYSDLLKHTPSLGLVNRLPKRDTVFSSKKALEINYNIQPDSVKITLLYENGETIYMIYKKNGKGFLRKIVDAG